MTGEEKHLHNLQIYLENGGSEKIYRQYQSPSLENRAKIAALIKNFPKRTIPAPVVKENLPEEKSADQPVPEKPKFLGFISQYPVELHKTYQNAFNYWLEACALKIELNSIPDEDEARALDLQIKIFEVFRKFDIQKEALDYYNEHKRILPTETKSDFSKLSSVELVTKRNTLRTLITKRKKTLDKRISELPDPTAPDFRKKQNFINRKKEELKELELQVELLNKKIKE
jgi:hypothetical protein